MAARKEASFRDAEKLSVPQKTISVSSKLHILPDSRLPDTSTPLMSPLGVEVGGGG